MKNIIIIISILFSSILLPSCSDFLEHQQYGPKSEWTSERDVRNAISALLMYADDVGRGAYWFEVASDNIVVGRSRASAEQIRNFSLAPDNGNDHRDDWSKMYVINQQAIERINAIAELDLDENFKEDMTGICYFYKGYSMLWLAPTYGDNGPNGGIPIVNETPLPGAEDTARPASVLENYDQIIKDLRTAGDMLPLFSELDPATEYGLPHKAGAWAYAARAALYAAQFDAKYYDIVIEMCDKVMALTGADKRELFDDSSANPHTNLWKKENNFSSEYIHSLLGNAERGPYFHGIGFENAAWSLYNTWGYFQPTKELYDSYEVDDVRRDATILYPGQSIQFIGENILFGGESLTLSGETKLWNTSSASGMVFRKYMDPWKEKDAVGADVNPNGNHMSSTLATSMIRFAEVVLMKAEALIWTKGEGNADAIALLNSIRKRARLPENSGATKAELKKERRVELVFEFQVSRHRDLVRWGDAQAAYNVSTFGVESKWNATTKKVEIETLLLNGPRTFDPKKHHVFPIPSRAFPGTKNLKQNYGY